MIRQIWEQHRAHVADLSHHRSLRALIISVLFAGSLPVFVAISPIVFYAVSPMEELEMIEGTVVHFETFGGKRSGQWRMVVRTDQRSEHTFHVPIISKNKSEILGLVGDRVIVHWNTRFEKPLLWLNSLGSERILQLESSKKVHLIYSYEREIDRRQMLRMIFLPFWTGSLAAIIYFLILYWPRMLGAGSKASQHSR